jgi:hypothetical protein
MASFKVAVGVAGGRLNGALCVLPLSVIVRFIGRDHRTTRTACTVFVFAPPPAPYA